jgi:hypothetical protein
MPKGRPSERLRIDNRRFGQDGRAFSFRIQNVGAGWSHGKAN